MKNPKRTASMVLLGIALIALLLWSYQRRQVIGKKYLRINTTDVLVEIAQTDATRARGLGNRDSLPDNTGMLFVFDDAKRWDFWMEGMRFGLDFIWIDSNKIVDISEKVPPPYKTGNTPVFVKPIAPVKYVLEVNEGWIKKHSIKINDRVEFHL
jgi:uncharacterized membrane protein (UPF0127 family)